MLTDEYVCLAEMHEFKLVPLVTNWASRAGIPPYQPSSRGAWNPE